MSVEPGNIESLKNRILDILEFCRLGYSGQELIGLTNEAFKQFGSKASGAEAPVVQGVEAKEQRVPAALVDPG